LDAAVYERDGFVGARDTSISTGIPGSFEWTHTAASLPRHGIETATTPVEEIFQELDTAASELSFTSFDPIRGFGADISHSA
jgi:hypothetical protein